MAIKVEQLADIEQKSSLPEGWHWKSIADVCLVNPSMSRPEGFLDTTEISFVPMSAVDDRTGTITSPEIRTVSDVWKGYKRFQNRDVIFARITPCMENGKAAIAGDLISGIACGSTEFHVLRAHPDKVIPEWLYHLVRQKSFRDEASANFTGTAGQLRVPASFLEQQIIPVPPVSEQERIVSRIEDLLRQIRTARAAFENIPSLLKAFRQSVLAAAFRGDLTEREAGDEPAEKLLERIRAECRRKWEEGLREKGKDPAKFMYSQPPAPDTSDLPELPKGWVWTTLGAIGEVSGGLTKNANRSKHHLRFPYISVANVYADELRLDEVREIGVLESEIGRTLLQKNDLLVVEGNGSVDQIGRVALWDGRIENCLHQNHIIKVRLASPAAPRFALYWLLSPLGRDDIAKVASSTSGLYTLSLSKVASLPIPLPPMEEQQRIISKLDTAFMQMTKIERGTEISSRRLDVLEQAALARAFRGEL